MPYFHVVFALPASIAEIAYQNKAVVYGILFKAAAQTLATIAADPRHLGARIGHIAVLHSWGQNLSYHPHLHCIVPGGGLSGDGREWIACKPGFFLPVRVLSRLFRRLFLEALTAAHEAGELQFFAGLTSLNGSKAFTAHLGPPRKVNWVVYAKRPFAGPEQVLAYLARYTHRVAIANSRIISCNDNAITFKWRDYRHRQRRKTMKLKPDEFIRRFLLHVLPPGCHRIRHYGLLANARRRANLALCRKLLQVQHETDVPEPIPEPAQEPANDNVRTQSWTACPGCGGMMIVTEVLAKPDRHHRIKRLDSS